MNFKAKVLNISKVILIVAVMVTVDSVRFFGPDATTAGNIIATNNIPNPVYNKVQTMEEL